VHPFQGLANRTVPLDHPRLPAAHAKAEVKAQAARRWTEAINADGQFGRWSFAIVHKPEEIRGLLDRA
jgi:hypothetical protein